MSYFPKPEKNENDLAIILREDVATRSVQAGQYVSWRGRTGKAINDIQQGDALSESLFEYDDDGVLNGADVMPFPDYTKAIKQPNDTLNAAGKTFVAPSNGWLYIGLWVHGTNANRLQIQLDIDGIRFWCKDDGYDTCSTYLIPLRKGSTVKVVTVNNVYSVQDNIYFIPK